jgi:hypothetical protein
MNSFYFQLLRILKRRGHLLRKPGYYVGHLRVMNVCGMTLFVKPHNVEVRGAYGYIKDMPIKGMNSDGTVDNWHELSTWMDMVLKKARHKKQRVFYRFIGGCK